MQIKLNYQEIQAKHCWDCEFWEHCGYPKWHYALQEIVSHKRQSPPYKNSNNIIVRFKT